MEVRRAGLSGVPLSLFLGERVSLLDEASDLAMRAAVIPVSASSSSSSSLLSFLVDSSVDQCVDLLERCCVSSYTSEYPNWVNVKNALLVVDSVWSKLAVSSVPVKERLRVVTKLKSVKARLFSSKNLRAPSAERVAARLEERRKHEGLLGGGISEDSPRNIEFQVALEVAQDTLRMVLRGLCWMYKMETIEGDGNCFFRAVVRALAPHVPRDHEDMLSLQLRKMVNDEKQLVSSQEIKELSAFEETDETDSKSMVRAGVWADHIQIAKTASLLGRKVLLLRCDDPELRMGEDGLLSPSEHYAIGSATAPAIYLYYQSSPGHFETLISSEERSMTESLNEQTPSLLHVCDCFFRLESAQSRLEDERSRARSLGVSTQQQQQGANTLLSQIVQFQEMVRQRFVVEQWRNDKLWHLFGELAESLVRDAKYSTGFGPLQMLIERARSFSLYEQAVLAQQQQQQQQYPPPLVAASRASDFEDDPWPIGMYSPTTTQLKSDKRFLDDDDDTVEAAEAAAAARRKPAVNPSLSTPLPASPAKPEPVSAVGNAQLSEASKLLQSDATLEVEWEQLLLSLVSSSFKELSARSITVSKNALLSLFAAISRLSETKKLKMSLHLSLEGCVLKDDVCEVLLKLPRNLSLVVLSKCNISELYKIKFNVKQSIQVK